MQCMIRVEKIEWSWGHCCQKLIASEIELKPQKKKKKGKKKSQIYWYRKINGALRYHITFEVEFNKKLAKLAIYHNMLVP